MTNSQRQLEANRRNALRSTGPRSEDGKRRAARNGLRHGMTSRAALLPDEDPRDVRRLLRGLHEHLRPIGEHELELVGRMATLMVRLRRCAVVEAELLIRRRPDPGANEVGTRLGSAYAKGSGAPLMESIGRHEAALERSLSRSLGMLERFQAVRRSAPLPPPARLEIAVSVDREHLSAFERGADVAAHE